MTIRKRDRNAFPNSGGSLWGNDQRVPNGAPRSQRQCFDDDYDDIAPFTQYNLPREDHFSSFQSSQPWNLGVIASAGSPYEPRGCGGSVQLVGGQYDGRNAHRRRNSAYDDTPYNSYLYDPRLQQQQRQLRSPYLLPLLARLRYRCVPVMDGKFWIVAKGCAVAALRRSVPQRNPAREPVRPLDRSAVVPITGTVGSGKTYAALEAATLWVADRGVVVYYSLSQITASAAATDFDEGMSQCLVQLFNLDVAVANETQVAKVFAQCVQVIVETATSQALWAELLTTKESIRVALVVDDLDGKPFLARAASAMGKKSEREVCDLLGMSRGVDLKVVLCGVGGS